ncbi:MAG: sensor histidine kinase [Anaerolineales bacterium]|nr:sensor histidine kinase [Anaerolineales bacterium]
MSSTISPRILRLAAWIWLGYFIAMGMMDFLLYTQFRLPVNPNLLPAGNTPSLTPRGGFFPVYLYYAVNGLVAGAFLTVAYWDSLQKILAYTFYPLLITTLSAAPILITVLIVPNFPNGPLANAEGMALRQLPILFIALALVAWQYDLIHVVLFSIATTTLELFLVFIAIPRNQAWLVLYFIAIIRTISFIAVGVFISLLMKQLREQQAALREANANLSHYAATLEQLTVSRERNRLARELHDTLAHSLTALSVTLETIKAYFDLDPTKTRTLIDGALTTTRAGIDETRRALRALRASPLEDMGLPLALQRAAESAAARANLTLTLNLPLDLPSLSPDVEQALYRIAQEAFENTCHHAQAKTLRVHLTHTPPHTILTIDDDGTGFDLHAQKRTGHFGLVGMQERAALVGGKLEIESEKGRGTKVMATI